MPRRARPLAVLQPGPMGALRWLGRLVGASLRHWYEDGAGQLAAAIAYYGLLSFLPFLLLLGHAALAMLGRDPVEVRELLASIRVFVPTFDDAAWVQLQDQVERHEAWSLASFVVLAFLASRVVYAAHHAVARIFDPDHVPPVVRGLMRAAASILLTAAAMVLLGLVFVTSSLVQYVSRSADTAPWLAEALAGTGLVRHVVPTLALFIVGWLAYRHAPVRRPTAVHAALGAAVFATGTHLAVVVQAKGVGALIENDLVYGSFVGVVTFVAWTWLVAALLLLGAEIVAVLEGARES
jgi:YihY family inner membrane protein